MTSSIGIFAHLASEASRKRMAFEATQLIEGGGLHIEARIWWHAPRSMRVEYKTYQSPWTELQEALSGQVELTGDELCACTLECEGHTSWIHDPATNTVLKKADRHLFEPIPGLSTIGELSFLDSLTQDFLLRDRGEITVNDQPIRRVSLKPKQVYRSQLLSSVTFPIRKATIDFDPETYFPLSISFQPSPDSPAASMLGPNATVQITYKDIEVSETTEGFHTFSPPAGARVFQEIALAGIDLRDEVPFSLPADILTKHGFDPTNGLALICKDAETERVYATVHYASSNAAAEDDSSAQHEASSQDEAASQDEASSQDEALSPRLTILVGNYISKTMARRRSTLSESGHSAEDDSLTLLDRKALWEERYPGIDTRFAPVEAFFEREGDFWFLSGTGMDLGSIEAVARDLLDSQPEKELIA